MAARRGVRIELSWRELKVGPMAKLVYVALRSHAGAGGLASVSLGRLAADCSLSPELVRRAVQELGELVKVTRTVGPHGGTGPNEYGLARLPRLGRRSGPRARPTPKPRRPRATKLVWDEGKVSGQTPELVARWRCLMGGEGPMATESAFQAEFRRAEAWLADNPRRQHGDIKAFLRNWFSETGRRARKRPEINDMWQGTQNGEVTL